MGDKFAIAGTALLTSLGSIKDSPNKTSEFKIQRFSDAPMTSTIRCHVQDARQDFKPESHYQMFTELFKETTKPRDPLSDKLPKELQLPGKMQLIKDIVEALKGDASFNFSEFIKSISNEGTISSNTLNQLAGMAREGKLLPIHLVDAHNISAFIKLGYLKELEDKEKSILSLAQSKEYQNLMKAYDKLEFAKKHGALSEKEANSLLTSDLDLINLSSGERLDVRTPNADDALSKLDEFNRLRESVDFAVANKFITAEQAEKVYSSGEKEKNHLMSQARWYQQNSDLVDSLFKDQYLTTQQYAELKQKLKFDVEPFKLSEDNSLANMLKYVREGARQGVVDSGQARMFSTLSKDKQNESFAQIKKLVDENNTISKGVMCGTVTNEEQKAFIEGRLTPDQEHSLLVRAKNLFLLSDFPD